MHCKLCGNFSDSGTKKLAYHVFGHLREEYCPNTFYKLEKNKTLTEDDLYVIAVALIYRIGYARGIGDCFDIPYAGKSPVPFIQFRDYMGYAIGKTKASPIVSHSNTEKAKEPFKMFMRHAVGVLHIHSRHHVPLFEEIEQAIEKFSYNKSDRKLKTSFYEVFPSDIRLWPYKFLEFLKSGEDEDAAVTVVEVDGFDIIEEVLPPPKKQQRVETTIRKVDSEAKTLYMDNIRLRIAQSKLEENYRLVMSVSQLRQQRIVELEKQLEHLASQNFDLLNP